MDFGKVLGGVWRPKSSIFVFFRCFGNVISFSSAIGKAKKTVDMSQQDAGSANLRLGSGDPQAGGERKGLGEKTLQVELREKMSRLASCDWTEPI